MPRKLTALMCQQCGGNFIGRTGSKYCSRSCTGRAGGLARHSIIDQSGPNNPNWKDGISKNHYHYKSIQKKRYPQRMAARQKAHDAMRRGRLAKKPCEICGNVNSQMHHIDYDKPLSVKWFCLFHHREQHKE